MSRLIFSVLMVFLLTHWLRGDDCGCWCRWIENACCRRPPRSGGRADRSRQPSLLPDACAPFYAVPAARPGYQASLPAQLLVVSAAELPAAWLAALPEVSAAAFSSALIRSRSLSMLRSSAA